MAKVVFHFKDVGARVARTTPKAASVKMKCACGTPVPGPQAMVIHRRSVWHAVARQARMLRRMGLSYAEVHRQLGGKLSRQRVWAALKNENL